MDYINSVTLQGIVEYLSIQEFDNSKIARISLSTVHRHLTHDGNVVTESYWHKIVVREDKANNRNLDGFSKGDLIRVNGKLTNRKYIDKDGIERFVTEIVAETLCHVMRK
jgi:single-strand DNA-binding protein